MTDSSTEATEKSFFTMKDMKVMKGEQKEKTKLSV